MILYYMGDYIMATKNKKINNDNYEYKNVYFSVSYDL